ncbi:hypothetical protein V6N13_104425 [Hibiscus sabdariffa]
MGFGYGVEENGGGSSVVAGMWNDAWRTMEVKDWARGDGRWVLALRFEGRCYVGFEQGGEMSMKMVEARV